MPYKLIKGEFHIHYPDIPKNGPEPDGDTLKFKPDNPALVLSLQQTGRGADFNRRGMVNLRFEGIDALETHFNESHQNLKWANAARNTMLETCGFGEITFFQDLPNKVETVEHHPQRGYILAGGLDVFGRIISFVFAGDSHFVDGAEIWAEEETIQNSLNMMLLEEGLAYPAFYTSLPCELRDVLGAATIKSRNNRKNMWENAVSVEENVAVPDVAALENLTIWPKLFRRLSKYFSAGFQNLDQFDSWLRDDPVNRDDRLILPDRELGNMHDIVIASGSNLRMLYQPEDLVVLPDDAMAIPPCTKKPVVERLSVRIMAALVNPIGPERGNETISLLNASANDINLGGWVIKDKANGKQPLQGTLVAGATVRIPLTNSVKLGNKGDTLSLFDTEEKLIHQVSYSKQQAQEEGWTVVF